MYLPEITLAQFSIFNVLRLGSYPPQIVRVATDKAARRRFPTPRGAYGSWLTVPRPHKQWSTFAVSIVNALGCAAVVVLTMWKRRQVSQVAPGQIDALHRRRAP